MDEVIPFLENVLRGKKVPRQRMMEVAHHYEQFGGVSPINGQIRALVQDLGPALRRRDIDLPVYWGNRNWNPMLVETLQKMTGDGVRRALAFVTSAYACYSGCRQYLEDIERARASVGPGAPEVRKLRLFFNHPGFVEANLQNLLEARRKLPPGRRAQSRLLFTAHSLPLPMALSSDYQRQLEETCRLVAGGASIEEYDLVYQSRSGPPHQPWLEPDVCDYLSELGSKGVRDVVISPIGFVSDHMEVVYDLDTEARALCRELGVNMVRAATAGTHPRFVEMICQLVEERLDPSQARLSSGNLGPAPDSCATTCCPNPYRRGGSGHSMD